MLDRVVKYLRSHNVPFRLSSLPSPEPLPLVAVRLPPGGLTLETHVVSVGGRPAIACVGRGAKLSLSRLSQDLGMEVLEGGTEDLPPPYAGAAGPVPALGGALGTITIIDESVAAASCVVFAAFSPADVIEIPYDDFARLEKPKIASFAIGGELPE